jgi:acylaminoacyl-peptidase
LAKNRNDTLIVFPHGGPHSSFACDFSIYNSIFYTLGFSILHLNFRGSSGYGQDSIESLPGNIGNNKIKKNQIHIVISFFVNPQALTMSMTVR